MLFPVSSVVGRATSRLPSLPPKSGLAAMVNPSLKDQKPIDFNPGITSGYIDDAPPRAVLTKHGLIVNACAGNDIREAGNTY